MGNIEEISLSKKEGGSKNLSLKKYPNQTTLSNGHTIIKLEDGSYGLFLSKSLAS